MKKELEKLAYEIGRKAQQENKTSIPVHCKKLMIILSSKDGKEVGALPLLRAWTKGWHQAKLEAELKDILVNDPLGVLR